ncbi:class I SAM-dependent methyltransferase [Mycobacterium sp. M1]|uniref:S-adenosyl-L-methionine-dependent methyltransferase n=1 Tax=Mycolicibacter acidiphilus TaxID=2835306 RepID=A0ABS5RL54_9MYCO|nr:class I SAM-dependent methyltransferase [Mycolicibacter acidiphilus]MBS9534899.1 class I SAM-dependent methyltransferase [Mycolicibacter acidiphilus]
MTRTDNDTWDLASSVGVTATMVAAGRARATRAGLIDDRFAEPLVTAVGVDFFTRWATGEIAAGDVDVPGQPWGMQPMTDLLAVRTRHIDEFVAAAAATGITQTVILASGLDARGYRLSWPATATVFEIDQPQVLDFKQSVLAGLNAQPTVDLRFVPIDLRDDWPTALRAAGFDPNRPTAWIAEGLLAFLPPDAQDRLLDAVTALSAERSRLLAEVFLTSPDSDQVHQQAEQRWREQGLDVELGELTYQGPRSDVATHLTGNGWQVERVLLRELLADSGFPVPTAGDGTVADNYYCTAVRTAR